jgi:predicted phosphoribosyltransferase
MNRPFADRREAGRVLAESLREFEGRSDVVVLALPRGGVPVGYEVAKTLGIPFDVFLVRKLGAPGQEELAMGAIASGGVVVINEEVVDGLRISWDLVEEAIHRERQELTRRERLYRGERPALEVDGRTVILVDDGLATGSTMRAAVRSLRRLRPDQIIVAVPTSARSTCDEFQSIADLCISVITPEPFRAVGLWYENFEQVTDQEVCDLLASSTQIADRNKSGHPISAPGSTFELESRETEA